MSTKLPCHIKLINECVYVLNQTWSPALKYRREHRIRELLPKCYWTLHSLRLNDKKDRFMNVTVNDYAHPDPNFKYPSDEKLKAELKEIAPSLYTDLDVEYFHQRMYEKHGRGIVRCISELEPTSKTTSKIDTSDAYFKKAVELAYEYNIGKYFKLCNPGRRKLQLAAMSDTIQSQIKSTPYIHVIEGQFEENGRTVTELVVDEVSLCFDKDFALTNCLWKNENATTTAHYVNFANCLVSVPERKNEEHSNENLQN